MNESELELIKISVGIDTDTLTLTIRAMMHDKHRVFFFSHKMHGFSKNSVSNMFKDFKSRYKCCLYAPTKHAALGMALARIGRVYDGDC